ncbi:MAG: hypothetical protein ACXWDM_03650 [Nocardioides sp.]
MSDDLSDGLAEPADTRTAQEAAALSEASTWVGGEVSAVGLGRTDDGAPCVIVYASAAGDIPAEVSGLPVRVVVSDPVLALADEDRPES